MKKKDVLTAAEALRAVQARMNEHLRVKRELSQVRLDADRSAHEHERHLVALEHELNEAQHQLLWAATKDLP